MALRFDETPPDTDTDGATGLLVLLGERPDDPWHWWRVGDDGAGRRYSFDPDADTPWEHEPIGRIVALIPAERAPVRIVPRGDMPIAQAVAATRLDPPGGRGIDGHAVSAARADGEAVLSAVVAPADMDVWLAELAARGLDADALVPAALLLPEATGDALIVGELAGQPLARTANAAFSGEPAMIEAMSDGRDADTLDADTIAARLGEVWRHPPLDLRTGPYARARVSYFRLPDWAQLARMTAILALLALLVLLVETVRLELAADAAEETALAAARDRFPAAGDLASAQSQIDAELARRGGGGMRFADSAPAVFSAMQPLPNIRLRTVSYTPDGTLTIRAAAPEVADLNAMLVALQRDGWQITVPPEIAPDATGATVADITVRAP